MVDIAGRPDSQFRIPVDLSLSPYMYEYCARRHGSMISTVQNVATWILLSLRIRGEIRWLWRVKGFSVIQGERTSSFTAFVLFV